MNERIEADCVIVIPAALVAELDELALAYTADLDGDPPTIRRMLEVAVLTHGLRVMHAQHAREENAKFEKKMGWDIEPTEMGT